MGEEYDFAVVGGGIAGLYSCLNIPSGKSVALFEGTGRFGGKVETVEMNGFLAEYGSMRFDPARQPMIGNLIVELGLETEPFPEYASPAVPGLDMMPGLDAGERGLNALQLFSLGIRRVLNKSESELMGISEEELESLRRDGTHHGHHLWQLGLWDALAGVLSYDAIKYIMMEGSFFHGIHENPGVAGTMITWVKMLQMSPFLKGIKGGMQLITDGMLSRVQNKGVRIYSRHFLQAMAPVRGNMVKLVFADGECTAKHIILALPSSALKLVRGIPDDIRALLDTVIEYPLLKCFFVIDHPWWTGDMPNVGARSIPTRELHYYRQGDKGNIMVYADRPSINYWNTYVDAAEHDRAEINRNRELPAAFTRRMKINPGQVVSWGIRDWVRTPYGAGVHLWKAGVEPWKISDRLEAFSLDGARPNVHICGEAFSHYQGFMEGALRSAHGALAKALD